MSNVETTLMTNEFTLSSKTVASTRNSPIEVSYYFATEAMHSVACKLGIGE